jgi:predicted nucleic acid-binding protein
VVVVDTNVLAYLLIEGDRTPQARALYVQDPDWRSEAFLLVEFSNLLATHVRAGALGSKVAQDVLAKAAHTLSGTVALPHAAALALAVELGVSAYDARFLAVARRLGGKLVTQDAKLRRAAPALTQTLDQALEKLP